MRAVFAFICLTFMASVSFASAAKPATTAAPGPLMYVSTWPHTIQVIDAKSETIIDHIQLSTDVAEQLILSPDKTKIYANTVRDNCIVTVDLAARKETDKFCLKTPAVLDRLQGFAIDPSGKYIYTVVTKITKQIDHYDIDEPQLAVIGINEKRIIRTENFPKSVLSEDANVVPGYRRSTLEISPNGKYLYIFRQGEGVLVFDTSTLQLDKTIDLSVPITPPGMTITGFNFHEDPSEPWGNLIGVFNATDPYVHVQKFGIAEIDLNNQTFKFTPIGPATTQMLPMVLSPDHSLGYTVAIYGKYGNRVTEFWTFDMKTRKIINKRTFLGRTRLALGITADGKKLMIYSAGFQIEFYDVKTLELTKTLDLGAITTMSNMVVMPEPGS
ncbi:MAG: YncE family protein [Acidobacteriaceae bacterium]